MAEKGPCPPEYTEENHHTDIADCIFCGGQFYGTFALPDRIGWIYERPEDGEEPYHDTNGFTTQPIFTHYIPCGQQARIN